MIELHSSEFGKVSKLAEQINYEKEYPFSIVNGMQDGRIFVDNVNNIKTVLLWHYCGFAYLVGKPNDIFVDTAIKLMMREVKENQQRFILQVDNKQLEVFFKSQKGIANSQRMNFDINRKKLPLDNLKVGEELSLKEVDEDILLNLKGRIIPSFSWSHPAQFLRYGKGYCVMHKNDVASCAFSAAIGGNSIDIGVETNEKYRGLGLGKIVALQMVNYILSVGAQPVWACHINNIASRKLAESIGFELSNVHSIFFKEEKHEG